MYALNTNVISELRKAGDGRADPNVTAWLSRCRAERGTLIAATAMVHGMSVVICNVADFTATGVALVNPWNPEG